MAGRHRKKDSAWQRESHAQIRQCDLSSAAADLEDGQGGTGSLLSVASVFAFLRIDRLSVLQPPLFTIQVVTTSSAHVPLEVRWEASSQHLSEHLIMLFSRLMVDMWI
jgi:hypothetical protein